MARWADALRQVDANDPEAVVALAKDTAGRYRSVDGMARDLERAVRNRVLQDRGCALLAGRRCHRQL